MKNKGFPYSAEIEDDIHYMYLSLSEKDRRHYAAIEAKKLGHGGITYISVLFSISEKTIREGISEFAKKTSYQRAYAEQAEAENAKRKNCPN